MTFSTTRLFPLGLMLALALLTFYLERAVRDDEAGPAVRRHDPDYMVANFTTTTYNPAGTVETVMSAARMVHYPDDDTTEVFSPRFMQAKPNQPRLTVSAKRGQLSRDGDELFLFGEVLVVREASAGRPEGRLSTEFLHVLRDRGLLRSDREVKFIEGGRMLQGRGMEYNNETRELHLREDVRARFQQFGTE